MHSNERSEIDEVRAGDICAVIGLEHVTTGDTLCALNDVVMLERIEFPEPVISVAVEPKSVQDAEAMRIALGKLAQEDPSFRVHTDVESGQTIIEGMGELHLEIVVDRMRREFNVEANVGVPRVAYRETVRTERRDRRTVRSPNGWTRSVRPRVAACRAAERRRAQGRPIASLTRSSRDAIPKECIAAVNKGVVEQMKHGVLAGYPLINVTVALFDGSFHETDSSEMAFEIAGSTALKAGALKADPALLEPVMKVEVVTPDDYMGDVVGDLNRRRGVIEGIDEGPAGKIIRAAVPMAEMFGYSTDLRSATQGRATYTMEFVRYQIVPDGIAEGIIKKS